MAVFHCGKVAGQLGDKWAQVGTSIEIRQLSGIHAGIVHK